MQHRKFITWNKRKIWKPKKSMKSQLNYNHTTSSKFETRECHSIISQLHHVTTTKHFAPPATF